MTGALQAIIFDFDGVIADSERLHLRAYQDVLAPLGLTLSDDTYYERYLGYDDVGSLEAYSRDNDLDWTGETIARLIAEKSGRYDELAARGEMLFAGAATFVRSAASAVPIAVASGALTHEIEEILERTGLRPLFTTIVGADQTARSKPDPDPYLEALSRLVSATARVIDPERTVAIEDSRWGLQSAAAAGLRCVAVANTYSSGELAAYAELVVSGLDALTLTALDTLCARTAPAGPYRGGA